MEQGGNAARPVATLLDLGAIGVEYPIEDRRVGAAGRLEDQRLVKPYPGVTIRNTPELVGG
jgi:hypothetical protein